MAYIDKYYQDHSIDFTEGDAMISRPDGNYLCNVCIKPVRYIDGLMSRCCQRIVCGRCLGVTVWEQDKRRSIICPVMPMYNFPNVDRVVEEGCYHEIDNPWLKEQQCGTCKVVSVAVVLQCCKTPVCADCFQQITDHMETLGEKDLCDFCGRYRDFMCCICLLMSTDPPLGCCGAYIHVGCMKRDKVTRVHYACPHCRSPDDDPTPSMQSVRLDHWPVVASWVVR